VRPTAELIGDMIIGSGYYVDPADCLCGDFGRLVIEEGSNLQDTCLMHGFPGSDTVIGVDGRICRGAVIHGARIGRNALAGMNAVVIDGAVIGESSFVAAMALVKTGMQVPPKSLVLGSPARIARTLSDKEIAWKRKGTLEYQNLVVRCLSERRKVDPLTAVAPDRKRLCIDNAMDLRKPKASDAR
jgi:phenylacetic acid degradation protein